MFDCDLRNGDVVEEHDSLIHCVIALVSVSNSESSKIRDMVSFLLTTAHCHSRSEPSHHKGIMRQKNKAMCASFSKIVG